MRGNVRLAQVPCCTDEADMIWEGFGFFFFPSMLLRHSAAPFSYAHANIMRPWGLRGDVSDGA